MATNRNARIAKFHYQAAFQNSHECVPLALEMFTVDEQKSDAGNARGSVSTLAVSRELGKMGMEEAGNG